MTGEASPNALVNLVESEVITQEWVNSYLESSKRSNEINTESSKRSNEINTDSNLNAEST